MVFTPTINNENNTNPKIDSKTLNNKAKEIPKPRNSLVHLHTNKAKKHIHFKNK
jgi:5,10-methenyltetrahydromethanopterin hydrogenase